MEEYLQTERYLKMKQNIRMELDNALQNLHSEDVVLRKQGAKRLNRDSRKELGWNCYPVRAWFLERQNKDALFCRIESEPDARIQSELFQTLSMFYERYIIHPFWQKVTTEVEIRLHSVELLSFARGFIENPSPDVRLEVAYILAMLEDGQAWDIYDELVQKRASAVNWLNIATGRYAAKSINRAQSEKLMATLRLIAAKTKNASVKRMAKETIALLQK